MSADEEHATQPPALSVIAGLTYLDHSQVFNRWFLPTYRTSFRWTGNRSDAEDATSWVFTHAVGRMQLPQSLGSVDDRVTVATLQNPCLRSRFLRRTNF